MARGALFTGIADLTGSYLGEDDMTRYEDLYALDGDD